MPNPHTTSVDLPLPILLRTARDAYAAAIRIALGDAGCDDVPRNGAYVVSAIARLGPQLSQIITELGVSKQAAGQLVDTLVVRGYLERTVDPDDRRRFNVALTERGLAAAAAVRKAVMLVGSQLEHLVSADDLASTRRTLHALSHITTIVSSQDG